MMSMCEYAKALGEVLKKFDVDALTKFVHSREEIDRFFAIWWDIAPEEQKELTLVKMIEARVDLKNDKELQLKVQNWRKEHGYEN